MTGSASNVPQGSVGAAAEPWTVDGVIAARVEDGIAHVTLNRHAKRNAITQEMADRFCDIADEFERTGTAVGVLGAAGTMFCAGVDLEEARQGRGAAVVERIVERLRTSSLLWIAEVQGGALGAAVPIVLSCHLVVMSEAAWLTLPEVSKLGRVPMGVVAMLTPAVGGHHALRVALSEERISAAAAHTLGWSAPPVPADELSAQVRAYATTLAAADESSRQAATALWARLHSSA